MRPFRLARFWMVALALVAAGLSPVIAAPPVEESAVTPFGGPPTDVVKAYTVWSADKALPGEGLTLAIVVDIQPGYHINADAGQAVMLGDFEPYATSVRVTDADPALTIETVRFPAAHGVLVEYAEGDLMSFEGRTIFYLPMMVVSEAAGDDVGLTVEFEYQACDDQSCFFPNTLTFTPRIPLSEGGQAAALHPEIFAGLSDSVAGGAVKGVGFDLFGWNFSIDASSGFGFFLLLLVAMAGGALLNFTPCVLPVIPIKIMSLANAAGSRGRMFRLGLTMCFGVVAFWLALGVLIALVSGFTATNQLFQYPLFTIGVGLVIAFMAVAMTGVWFVQLPQSVYKFNPSQESYPGSFGFGVMTAILSTPCTAPFMGAAAAWAATQHPGTTLGTFAAIGAGMALPYFVLSASPDLVRKMPRTGPASELIKQVMGLFMLAAAAYFVGVGVSALLVTAPDPSSKTYWWVVMAFLAAGGGWLAYQTYKITRNVARRALFGGIGALAIVASVFGGLSLTDKGPIDWVYYTPERFQQALDANQVVVLDFTAEWCLNCKTLEHGVLNKPQVAGLLAQPGVLPIKVDITGNNPMGKAKLKEAGRLTIPLLVVYSATGQEVFKSDFYTADQVVQAVNEAREVAEYDPR